MNQTQILSNYTNGSAALGGAVPTSVIELNLTWNRPTEAGVWGGFVDLTLDSGGLIRLPYSFVLIDPAPEISFSLPNGTRTNQTLDISMHSYDQGTGFNISGMTFDVDSQWPGAPIPFSATLETISVDGPHSSDYLGLWNHWNTHRIFSAGDHFAASSNSLTLEAESAMNILAGEGPEWSFSNSNSDYSGTGYMTTVYDGFDSLNQSSGAHLSWDVEFDSTGVYWVWVRLNQHSEQANAIHVGMDGILQTIGDEGLSVNGTGWTWSNSVYGQNISTPVGLNVTTPGRHTVDIWVKESGVDFDRLELTTSPTWIPPTGNASNYSAAAIRWNDLTLRSAWLNWSLPSDNRWHEYSGETLDLTNRLDQTQLRIEYDDIAPPLAIHNWRMFTNQPHLTDTWAMTDPEATFWLNGTELPVDEEGRVDLDLELQPTIWGRPNSDPASAEFWDTSTWQWHGMNEFTFIARDPAGNWNAANASMVFDPWAPDNSGPTDQLSFDSILVPEWGDAYVPIQSEQPYSFEAGEISITRLFDGREICLTIISSIGTEMEQQCHIDNAPPWDEIPYSNRPIMEENRFMINFTNWADDLYELKLEVTDWANNTGSHSAEILIDRTAPTITIETPQENQVLLDHHLEIAWNVSESSYQWVEVNGDNLWSSGQFNNASQDLLVELGRTGNHTICIFAWDDTAIEGIVDPNLSERCIEVTLPEETYWPSLDAPWNNTHVNTSRVWAQLTLGPDQLYEWWHDGINGTVYEIENGSVVIPIDLNTGENHLLFHLEALEKTFVYELTVVLDQEPPLLMVLSPEDGYATYRSIANVEGQCEYGLLVYINISGLVSQGNCTEEGTFSIESSLPIIEGDWYLVTYQIDLAGNRAVDIRTIITDKTAPSANVIWNQTECDRRPTAPAWGTPSDADCFVTADLSILSQDVVEWSIVLQNAEVDVFSQSGTGSEFDGMQPESFSAQGIPGEWAATVELIDAAGNRQRLQISTNLNAPEATVGEQLKTPGSLHNLAAVGIFVMLLIVMQNMRTRKPPESESWGVDQSNEIHDADSMFEDDVVVSHEEATPSNTE